MSNISGKTVVITGASRGIGASTARVFAKAGANVALLARSADALSELAGEIGAQALAIPCDVTSFRSVEAAMDTARTHFGRLDVLINNAGTIDPIGMLDQTDPAIWGRAVDINLKGVYHGMRAVMPMMIGAGGGTIITISSGAAHNALEGWSAYCASKAGSAMLSACADREGRGKGLRVMALSPGTVATDMQRTIRASGINPVSQLDWSDHIPAEWPAKALLWMCGPEADPYIGKEISLRDPEIRSLLGLLDD